MNDDRTRGGHVDKGPYSGRWWVHRDQYRAAPDDDGGYAITLADKTYRGRLEQYFPDPAERARLTVVEDDFAEPAAYERLDCEYDQVYMMAAIVGVNRTLEHPEEVIRVNTALTLSTLEWLRRIPDSCLPQRLWRDLPEPPAELTAG
ncbi:MAG: NAD-dependent epimerase/dehydratase family protein [Spiribacter salinus]|uniref:NAD-dependent epimerase/dehydratase family protein n=1 Tax=Spiribacter salinus TaxID=1335746 RepID=A0A540VP88_9GAMM|nr:MAG: NAD-dependent epimerase/dehydratase family protein [Spiribacter salinus]